MSDYLTILSDWQKFKILFARFYHFIWNPYQLNLPRGCCPVQSMGVLPTGEYYYFRARYNTWSFEISETENAWSKHKTLYSITEKHGETPYDAGYMYVLKAYRIMNKHVKKYYRIKKVI
jgi:hypothetical protein